MNWYLKKIDGEVYGPVDLATLQLWATDSRIAPEDHVSTDAKTWKPAPEIPDLGMVWKVELRDGEWFGPVNLLAVKELIQEGSVSRKGVAENIQNGEKTVISDALVPALIGQVIRMQGVIDAMGEPLAAAGGNEPATAAAEEKERLEAEIRKLTEQRDRFEQEAAKWRQSCEDGAGTAAARESQLKARFTTVKATEARLDGLKQEVENSRSLFEQERVASRTREAELKEQIRQLKAGAHEVQELAQQVEKWKSLYEHLQASADAARTKGVRAAAEPSNGELVPKARLEETERKLAQVQKSYQHLLRAANRNITPRGNGKAPPADNLRRWQVG